jgi:predicted RND superfamily exporter protein
MTTRRALVVRLLAVAIVSLVAATMSSRLHVSGDLSALFPDHGGAAMLARVVRAFGGGDLAIVLVRGDDPKEVEAGASEIGKALADRPTVVGVVDQAPPRETDPSLAWIFAGPRARDRLAAALTPEGMRGRLAGSKELLLGPAAGEAADWLARDPLRLALVPWDERAEIAAGLTVSSDGAFVADGGRARLVALQPRGRAFDSDAAHAFVADVDAARAAVVAAHPGLSIELAGGHATAVATEAMIRADMEWSSALSSVLATVVFLLTFRRMRAALAVLPPLVLGTLWTLAIAATFNGLTAVSVAFGAVVIGVGVDTGVHVYAALLDGLRSGLSHAEAAVEARRKTQRPVMLAAIAAGACFAALALSELRALRELGILCGAGEVLTSLAILAVTPELGALVERGEPPPPLRGRWIALLDRATATRPRAAVALGLALLPLLFLAAMGGPRVGEAIVAIRPAALAPLATQAKIFELFGGTPNQWILVTHDRDPVEARARADAVAEALDPLVADGTVLGYDTLSSFAPSPRTVERRLAARDALDLPAAAERLAKELADGGWDVDALAPAIEALRHPSRAQRTEPPPWMVARYMAEDSGETLVLTFVRPPSDTVHHARIIEAAKAADPELVFTGYPVLEKALKEGLARELPEVAAVALLVVVFALSASLRSLRSVVLAAGTILISVAFVAAAMRVLGIGWHVYDALVLPVLLGITMDEAMFLLHSADKHEGAIGETLAEQGPLVLSTALTTAAGFGALVICRFDGLRDVGAVGALGSVAGVLSALLVVPAGLRLWPRRATVAERSLAK